VLLSASALIFTADAFPLRAQNQPQLAPPLPAQPLRPSATDPLQLLPGENLLLTPSTPPLQPAPETRFKLKLPPDAIRPVLPPLSPAFGATNMLASRGKLFVKGFRFKGGSVFKEAKLQATVARFKNREVTGAEIEQAREDLTMLYVEAGYINSGAVLEDQDLQDGIVLFTLVEGRLTEVNVSGNRWLRSWALRNAFRHSAGTPLNIRSLKEGLELMRQDPNIRQLNAELKPGGKPGESSLDVTVKENQPFHFSMEFSNRRPPSVGSEILEFNTSMQSLTGHADPISLRYGPLHSASETMDRWEWDGDGNIEASYQFPISPWKTTLELHVSRNDSSIVDEAFRELNITSRTSQLGATLRQPLYETLNHLFAISVTGDYRKNDTFLLDRPFSLSPGAFEGETKVFVLRLAMEYVNRSQQHVLALRSTCNIGLDAFGATDRRNIVFGETRIGPGAEFFSWLGQAQYVQRLFETDKLVVLRLNAFFSNNPLLSLEQFSIGGVQSVRGYRENDLLRDNGIFGSLEFHVPIWRRKDKSAILTLVPFFDIGSGWDNVEFVGSPPRGGVDERRDTLASIGAGLILTPTKAINAQLYWGCALNRDRELFNQDGKNLQDYGLHFSVSVSAF